MGILNDFFHWMMIDNSIRKMKEPEVAKVKKQPQKEYADYASKQGGYAEEKRYLSCVNLIVDDSYDPEFSEEVYDHLNNISNKMASLYKQICYNPIEFEKELMVLEACVLNYEFDTALLPIIHSRVSHIVDHLELNGPANVFSKQMAYVIDAEAFFAEGDMLNALKRLFSALNWNLMLEQATLPLNRMNGLEDMYEACIINILNIFKLLGMYDEVEKVNKIFRKFIKFDTERYQEMIVQSLGPDNRAVCTKVYNAYLTDNKNFTYMRTFFPDSGKSEILDSTFICGREYNYLAGRFYPEYITEYGEYLNWFELTGKKTDIVCQVDAVREWLNNKI